MFYIKQLNFLYPYSLWTFEKSLEIFQLPSLLYTKITVEEPYKPRTIPQCQNCQDYGHTRSYCGYRVSSSLRDAMSLRNSNDVTSPTTKVNFFMTILT